METSETTKETSIYDKLPTRQVETKLPVKQKQELIPYEKENYSSIEKAIIELSEELSNLSELREAIELSFSKKNTTDNKFQEEVVSCFNTIVNKFDELSKKFDKEIDYNNELQLQIDNASYKQQVYLLTRELNEERASITKTLDEIKNVVKENISTISDKCRELKTANNLIEENIMKFRADSMAASENEYKALKNQCENLLKTFTENAKTTLETVKKTSIDFITQCEKENKSLINKVPVVKGKLTAESWIVILFGCFGIASLFINLFVR